MFRGRQAANSPQVAAEWTRPAATQEEKTEMFSSAQRRHDLRATDN
jgi:hypothetical protein